MLSLPRVSYRLVRVFLAFYSGCASTQTDICAPTHFGIESFPMCPKADYAGGMTVSQRGGVQGDMQGIYNGGVDKCANGGWGEQISSSSSRLLPSRASYILPAIPQSPQNGLGSGGGARGLGLH